MKTAVLLVFCLSLILNKKRMNYIEFPADRKIPDTKLEEQKHLAILVDEELETLPDQFSICSSIYMGYYRDSMIFFTIVAPDSLRWLNVNIHHDDVDFSKEVVWLNAKFSSIIGDGFNPIRPWAWSHSCVGVDLIIKEITWMVNQVRMSNVTFNDTDFIESKPLSLHRKLAFGDWYFPGRKVLQSECSVTNVHVYKRLLTDQEMYNFTGNGACRQHGDYIAWEDMVFDLLGDTKINSLEEDICEAELDRTNVFLFHEYFSWPSCMNLCQMIQRGRVPKLSTKDEVDDLIQWNRKLPNPATIVWSPYSDEDQEGVWKDFYSDIIMLEPDLFLQGEPNGKTIENCLSLSFKLNGWNDVPCANKRSLYNCVCSFMEVPILKLRGLCPDSNIDAFYTLYQEENLAFYGLQQTTIHYDEQGDCWKAKVVTLPTVAMIRAEKGHSMIFGKHIWKIKDDSTSCNESESALKVLKFTGCQDGEFTCSDGQCISMAERCDQVMNCRDESDEMECKIVSMKANYNKKIPPFDKDRKAVVNVSIELLSINDIRHSINNFKLCKSLNYCFEGDSSVENLHKKCKLRTSLNMF